MNKSTTNRGFSVLKWYAGISLLLGFFIAFDQSFWFGMSAIQTFFLVALYYAMIFLFWSFVPSLIGWAIYMLFKILLALIKIDAGEGTAVWAIIVTFIVGLAFWGALPFENSDILSFICSLDSACYRRL